MKNLFKFGISMLLSSVACYGQSLTTVTATITDPSTQPFVSGTATAEYQRPANSQGITPVINGTPIDERPPLVGMDGSGTFVINLANLALVSPAGGSWRFILCPNASASCAIANTAQIIGASVNLSAALSAQVILISVPAQPHVFRAYKDAEIIAAPGVVWLDVTLNVVKYIDALGIIHTLGGGVIGVTPGGGLVLTGSTVGIRTDCSSNSVVLWSGVAWNCATLVSIFGSGTPGTHSKWITSTTLGDSLISETGSLITANGSLNINNNLQVTGTSLFLDQATFQSTGFACGMFFTNIAGTRTNQLCENLTGAGFINHMPGQDGILATLNDPVFTGDPRAPTPSTGDNDTSIATTAFVKNQGYIPSTSITEVHGTTGHIILPGGTILQWFTGTSDPAGVNADYIKTFPLAFPTACDHAQITYDSNVANNNNDWYIFVSCNTTTITVGKRGTGGTDSASNARIYAIGH